MKLYIMRHGETDWNKARRLQGKSDIPLNDFGRRLARETAEGLKEIPFDLVITSPLIRAKETALIVKGDRNIPVIEEERLAEMTFGEYEGFCCKGEGFDIPDPEFKNFFEAPQKYCPTGGGEDFETFLARIEHFLKELYRNREYEEKTILVSTHGAVIRAVLASIRKTPLADFWGNGVHKNCAVTIVEIKNQTPSVIAENVTYYEAETEQW